MRNFFTALMLLTTFSSAFGGCPKLVNADVPNGNTSSAGYVAKRVNTNNTVSKTIFTCKEPRPASDMKLTYSKNDFIGNPTGTDKISLGNFSGTAEIGSDALIDNTNAVGSYNLHEQGTKILATQPRTWNERTIWHFYKRNKGITCSWNIHKSIRTYLRNNPSTFDLGSHNPDPITDRTKDWSIAKLDDAILKNTNGKSLKADIKFYWLQNKNGGGGRRTGGNWADGTWGSPSYYRYCHFAVAVELKLKTNFHGSGYDINEAGEYEVTIGTRVKND